MVCLLDSALMMPYHRDFYQKRYTSTVLKIANLITVQAFYQNRQNRTHPIAIDWVLLTEGAIQ